MCSKNQWRSPTAEALFRKDPLFSARSAGTSRSARHTVSVKDIDWADIIFVMEEKHKSRFKADLRRVLEHKLLHVVDIPDDYHFMDPELIKILEDILPGFLSAYS